MEGRIVGGDASASVDPVQTSAQRISRHGAKRVRSRGIRPTAGVRSLEVVRSCPENMAMRTVNLGDLYAESGQTLQGAFLAASMPNFASNYSLESSRRDLHNALLCTRL